MKTTPKTKAPNVITLQTLIALGACEEHRALFEQTFGTEAKVTKANVRKAFKAGLNFDWAAKKLLTDSQRKLYNETETPAWKLYDETKAPPLKLYEETIAPALKLYEETIAPALKLYEETIAPARKLYTETETQARKLYNETEAQALKLYEETKAQAFYAAWKSKG